MNAAPTTESIQVEPSKHPFLVADNLAPLVLALGDDLACWPGQRGDLMRHLEQIEADMLRYEQADIPLEHLLLPGLYARKITIPADCRLIGKIQLHPHLNVLLEGDITFMVDGVVRRVQAGWSGGIAGGTKKIGYAHAKSVWMTVHPNPDHETDIQVLERRIVADNYAQYLERMAKPALEGDRP
jgi:hypothetical protein